MVANRTVIPLPVLETWSTRVKALLTKILAQVSIVANYIKERTKNAQFIVISLRNNMFELASRLVGVYKVNHMTKSVTIDNRDFIDRPPRQAQQRPVMGGGGLTTTLALR